MARKERRAPGDDRLRGLLDAGDHRGARALARERLADPAASELQRAQAAEVLASLARDRSVVVTAAAGVALALAVGLWTILAG